MVELQADLTGPSFLAAVATSLAAAVDPRSIASFVITRRPTTPPSPAPTQHPTTPPKPVPTQPPTTSPTPLPSGAPSILPTPLPSGQPSPLPSSAPTIAFSHSYAYDDDYGGGGGDDDAGDPVGCVCMSAVMVGRIALHCPHVAHHFSEAGCLSMSGEELEAIGETCPGLRGTYA